MHHALNLAPRWCWPALACLVGTLLVPGAAQAQAQFLKEAARVKFGAGCVERLKPKQAGLGACLIAGGRARVWCPNGKVYERDGPLPDMSLVYSVCGLNQRL